MNIKSVRLDPRRFRDEIRTLAQNMSGGEKVVLVIDLKDYNIVNEVVRVCRDSGLSVIDGSNNDREILLVVMRRV
ncbi:MAG: hypothetical protein QXJ51_04640 [Sulfolobales archaeon]